MRSTPATHVATRIAARATTLSALAAASLLALAGCSEYEDPDGPSTNAEGATPGGVAQDLPADDAPGSRPFGPVDVPGDTRTIAGLYDASIERPLGTDVRYVLITVDGVLVVHDYDLDPYGTGLNCYRDGRPLPLVRDRGDDYLLDGRSVRIAREALGIGFGYTDTLDDDRDGDIAEFLYYRYPRADGLSDVDFAACD